MSFPSPTPTPTLMAFLFPFSFPLSTLEPSVGNPAFSSCVTEWPTTPACVASSPAVSHPETPRVNKNLGEDVLQSSPAKHVLGLWFDP